MKSLASNGRSVGDGMGLIQQRLSCKYQGWLLMLTLLCLSPAMSAQQPITTYYPLLPKYQVLGVMYAPPGDYTSSNVSYNQSNTVGSSHSQSFTSSNTQTQTNTTTLGFSLWGFGSQTQNTVSDAWTTQTESTSSINITSMKSNGISVLGPSIGGSVGIDHDFDLIVLWLNPLTNTTLTYNPNAMHKFSFLWQGYQYNSCELGNANDPVNFYQLISGCDQLQGLQPDIVNMPVWCLKNPYSLQQLPGSPSTCVQWWQNQGQQLYLSRYWDQNSWGPDPTTGVALGPGLTVQDFADILRADPYVTQTLVADNYQAGENPYTSPCHPTYGLDFNPDGTETIPDSSTFSAPFSGKQWPTDYCGSPGKTMARMDNQQINVPYQTGSQSNETVSRSVLSNNATTATDTHTHSDTTTITNSFDFSASIGIPLSEGVSLSSSLFSDSFNFSSSSGTGNSYTDVQAHSSGDTIGTSSMTSWLITGPAAMDNYKGPLTMAAYVDNVYGTFSFWYQQTLLNPPTLPTSSPIGVKMATTASGVTCSTPTTCNFGTVTVGKSSGAVTVTLTNASPYQMTMTSPSLSFSDLAPDATSNYAQVSSFVIVAGSDLCAGKLLLSGKTCTVKIKFSPRLVDAPNTLKPNYPVAAYMVAAGTEGIPFYKGGTCATGYCSSVLVTNTVVNVTGPGKETYTAVSGTAVPAAATCTGIEPSCNTGATLTPPTLTFAANATSGTQAYTFTNYASTPVTINSLQLSDTTDYSITSDLCTGTTVPSLKTCTFTLVYSAKGVGLLNTKVSVLQTMSGTSTTLAFAGAAASVFTNGMTLTGPGTVENVFVASLTVTNTSNGNNLSNMAIKVGNETGQPGAWQPALGSCSGATLAPGASCTAYINFHPSNCSSNGCQASATVTVTGTEAISVQAQTNITFIFFP